MIDKLQSFLVSHLHNFLSDIGIKLGLPALVVIIIVILLAFKFKKKDVMIIAETEPKVKKLGALQKTMNKMKNIYTAFKNLYRNLKILINGNLADLSEGPVGPAGLQGLIGLPGDYMYQEWLKTHPDQTVDDFVEWFVKALQSEVNSIYPADKQTNINTETAKKPVTRKSNRNLKVIKKET